MHHQLQSIQMRITLKHTSPDNYQINKPALVYCQIPEHERQYMWLILQMYNISVMIYIVKYFNYEKNND